MHLWLLIYPLPHKKEGHVDLRKILIHRFLSKAVVIVKGSLHIFQIWISVLDMHNILYLFSYKSSTINLLSLKFLYLWFVIAIDFSKMVLRYFSVGFGHYILRFSYI